MYVGPHNNWLTLEEVTARLLAVDLSLEMVSNSTAKVSPVMIQGAQHWKEDDVEAYITNHKAK